MKPIRFVLIRHGESEWNAAGRWQGHGDPALSPRGRTQAAEVAAALVGEGIDVVVASDLARAAETAAPLAALLGVGVLPDRRLRELDVGRWSGLTRAEIEAGDAVALAAFERGGGADRAGGGECRSDVAKRVRAAIADIAELHAGRCIAVVAHLGVFRELLPGSDLGNGEWRCVPASEISRPPSGAVARVLPSAH